MENSTWLYDKNTPDLINLEGLGNVYLMEDTDYDEPYQLVLWYKESGKEVKLWYKDIKQRDNMFLHMINHLNPTEIDSNQKPLTL
jgi:hypothetical protein